MEPILTVRFYRTSGGNEPVREWLQPLVRKIEPRLWEIRSHVPDGIARVFFTAVGTRMVLLHGFIKKSQATPADDLTTARRRNKEVPRG